MTTLPVSRACDLPVCPPEHRWLVEDLWADEAVGIIGGEPKCGKSFLALDRVVAVAGGVPCLSKMNRPLRCAACGSLDVRKLRTTTNLKEPLPYLWVRCEQCGDVWPVPRQVWDDQDRSETQ